MVAKGNYRQSATFYKYARHRCEHEKPAILQISPIDQQFLLYRSIKRWLSLLLDWALI